MMGACDNTGRVGAQSQAGNFSSLITRDITVCRNATFSAYNPYTMSLEIPANLNLTAYDFDPNVGTVINTWAIDALDLGKESVHYDDPAANVPFDGYYFIPNVASGEGSYDIEARNHVLVNSNAGTRTLMIVLHRDDVETVIQRVVEAPPADITVPTELHVTAPAVHLLPADIVTINFLHTAPNTSTVYVLPGDYSLFSVKKNLVQ